MTINIFHSINSGYIKTETLTASNINIEFFNALAFPALKSEYITVVYVIGTSQRVQITELTIKSLRENI